jgi:DNA polymerase III gamma/tau subunit
MRDAQGLFDMAASYCDNNITFEKLKSFFNLAESDVYFNITDKIKAKDAESLLKYFDDVVSRGYDMQTFLDGLTEHYRNLLIAVSTNSADLIVESESIKQKYLSNTSVFSQIEVVNSLKLLLQAEYTFKYSSNQRTLLETLLIELIKFTDTKDIKNVLDELKNLKSGSSNVNISNPSGSYGVSTTAASKPKAAEKPVEMTGSYTVSAPQNISAPPSVSSTIDIKSAYQDMQSHWGAIINLIKDEKRFVYSILKNSSFSSDGKDTCMVRVDETNLELLERHQAYLSGVISNYFGQPMKLNFEKEIPDTKEEPSSSAGTEPGAGNYERIRSILVNDLHAKEVNTHGK